MQSTSHAWKEAQHAQLEHALCSFPGFDAASRVFENEIKPN